MVEDFIVVVLFNFFKKINFLRVVDLLPVIFDPGDSIYTVYINTTLGH